MKGELEIIQLPCFTAKYQKEGKPRPASYADPAYPFSSALNLRESLKTTTLRAGRVIASLVWGLRPLRAFLS